MSTIALPANRLRFRGQQSPVPFASVVSPYAGASDLPQYPNAPVHHAQSLQAQSLRLVQFGAGLTAADHLKLESSFIAQLSIGKDEDTVAGAADLLGRAKSMNALPHLLKKLSIKEPISVRVASAKAAGMIGASTDANSFARNTIAQAVINHYGSAKMEMLTAKRQPSTPMPLEAKRNLNDLQKEQVAELAILLKTLGQVNSAAGNQFLKKEVEALQHTLEVMAANTSALTDALQQADTQFNTGLEQQHGKAIDAIKSTMTKEAFKQLRESFSVTTQIKADGLAAPNSDGPQQLTIGQAVMMLRQMHHHQRWMNDLLLGAYKAVATKNTPESNTLLRGGLRSPDPAIKAMVLKTLGRRGELHYASEIYPDLTHSAPQVRQTAIETLFYSSDKTARQKLVELLNPVQFFQTMQVPVNPDSLKLFVGFLNAFARNGDKFVTTLGRVATDKAFDPQTRQMAAMTLGLMTQPPASNNLTGKTVREAQQTLETLATKPEANEPDVRTALSLFATKLWLGSKDCEAIERALAMATGKLAKLPVAEQEELMVAVDQALHQRPAVATKQDEAVNQLAERLVLSALKKSNNPLFAKATLAQLESQLKPSLREALNTEDKQNPIVPFSTYFNLPVDRSFVKQVRVNMDRMRPELHQMLNHPQSALARLVSARILGTLGDNNPKTVDKLIESTRKPLQGLLDWSQPLSFKGDPSRYGANIRVHNLEALGKVQSAKAVDVMVDALQDPVLRHYTVAPLGMLANAVNRAGDKHQLEKVLKHLGDVMKRDDASRVGRNLRIASASALAKYTGGVTVVKDYIQTVANPNYKRHAMAALVMNDYALDPKHPDHALVRPMLVPELDVEKLHAQGITGKDVGIAIIDGGYVDHANTDAFQDRVRIPAKANTPGHSHPTMVASTAAAKGQITGVAPDSTIYSDMWPEIDGEDPMAGYKMLIAGKLRGENNIRVINNSWGLTNNAVLIYKDIRTLLKEFKKTVEMAEKAGIQFVFSAGNEGEGLGFPSVGTLTLFGIDADKLTADEKKDLDYALDKVILVGASNTQGLPNVKDHQLADFSSMGDVLDRKLKPTVVAPGVDMMVHSWEEEGQPKDLVNGTSFSGPYTSALVALMADANSAITNEQIRTILVATADKLPNLPDSHQGYGQVNPHAAIAEAKALVSKPA